jgi:hypothetical protein
MKQYKQVQLNSEISIFEILTLIPNYNKLSWKILWITAVSTLEINILEIEKKNNSSKDGEFISMQELRSLFHNIIDLQELLLIGDFVESNLQRYIDDENMFSNCAVVIEKIDSSYWLVTTHFI